REHLVEHGAAELVLRWEVVQERRLADADGLGDLLEGGAVEAAPREEARGRGEDLVTHLGLGLGLRNGAHAAPYQVVGALLPCGSRGGKCNPRGALLDSQNTQSPRRPAMRVAIRALPVLILTASVLCEVSASAGAANTAQGTLSCTGKSKRRFDLY